MSLFIKKSFYLDLLVSNKEVLRFESDTKYTQLIEFI